MGNSLNVVTSENKLNVSAGDQSLVLTSNSHKLIIKEVGLRGLPGQSSPPYEHTQTDASSIWTIVHGLGHMADITIYDENDEQVIGDVSHDSDLVTTVTFSQPVAGRARAD